MKRGRPFWIAEIERRKGCAMTSLIWPKIADEGTAIKTTRLGFLASIFCGILHMAQGGSPYLLINAMVFGIIGWGILRKSKGAAIFGLVFYLYTSIYDWVARPRESALDILVDVFFRLLFVLAFTASIRGAFAYHELVEKRIQSADMEIDIER
jgi:hypothetical protein